MAEAVSVYCGSVFGCIKEQKTDRSAGSEDIFCHIFLLCCASTLAYVDDKKRDG